MNQKSNDWNPNQYLQYEKERTQPAIDLASRIDLERPDSIIDIGCGPGNSTSVLKSRWPSSSILGIDNSESMISKAKEKYPEGNWQVRDVANLGKEQYDVVFSNAMIQWIPNHEFLLNNLLSSTKSNGYLAIQMPLYHQMPVYDLVEEIFVKSYKNNDFNIRNVFNFNDSEYYFDLLADSVKKLEIWETDYIHVMKSFKEIFNMIETAGVKPYMDNIQSNEDKKSFAQEISNNLNKIYRTQNNGKVLFPFERLFILARSFLVQFT